MSTISVRVNFQRLRERLSAERGTELTLFDVRQWLYDEGFDVIRDGEWLTAREETLPLRNEEIVDRIDLETQDGVTFATTRHQMQ